MMSAKPWVLLLAALLAGPATGAETVLRCIDEIDAGVSRRVCAQEPVTGDFKIALPDPVTPVITDTGRGLSFSLNLPEPPPATVMIAPRELAPVLPPFPVVAVVPPSPPPTPVPLPIPQTSPAPVIADAASMPPEVLEAALGRLKAGTRISDEEARDVLTFYAARGFTPLWLADGRWNARADAVRATIAHAHADGMEPVRYRSVARFVAVGEPQWQALAAAEAQLSEAVVLFAREAATGRVRPRDVHELITPRLRPEKADAVLARLAEAADAGAALASFQPPHPAFQALKAALADIRAKRPAMAAVEPIPDGPPLRIGMRDPRVPLIRARLGLGLDDASVYDRSVSIKVAGLQKANGLPMTGVFTPQTRRVLSGEGPTTEEAEIIANMEFWRWMPRELGRDHILVNTPAYDMTVTRGGREIHRARTIVGKQETQTPFFSDEMDHIVVNPSWYIPPGILKREPKYLSPGYAEARGYEIRTRGSITTVRVPPGSSNALGYVKFMFPNEHAVYLHDTPNRGLFNARNRTLSNGCVRVENPMQLAALLFDTEGMTEERFRRMQGGGERRMNLPRKMPVHLGYFTVMPGVDGALVTYPDVYGHARRLRQLLGLS